MPTYWPYSRFSSAAQRDGDSIKRQSEALASWIKRSGVRPEDVRTPVVDEGLSGYKGVHLRDGGGLARIIQRIDRGEVAPGDVIVVEALDRLSRLRPTDAQELVLRIVKAGVAIAVIDGGYTITRRGLDSGDGTIWRLIGEVEGAHRQSHLKSKRVAHSWKSRREAATKNVRTKHKHPQWLSWNDDMAVYEVVPGRGEIIVRIFGMAKTVGSRVIARTLNEEGVEGFGPSGRWTAAYVQKILGSRTVLGEVEFTSGERDEDGYGVLDDHGRNVFVGTGNVVEDYYPRVVSDALWHEVNKRREEDTFWTGGGGYATNLFDGIIKCACCGGPMYLRMSIRRNLKRTKTALKRYRYFRCNASLEANCGNVVTFTREEIDERILDFLGDDLESFAEPEDGGQLKKLRERAGTLSVEVERLDQRIANWLDALGELPRSAQTDLREKVTKASERRDQAKSELRKIERAMTDAVQPAEEVRKNVETIRREVETAMAGDDEARLKVRKAVKFILKKVECREDGGIALTFRAPWRMPVVLLEGRVWIDPKWKPMPVDGDKVKKWD